MVETCPNCNKTLTCQAEAGQCWCMSYPSILPIEEENKGCLCAGCLKEKIQIAIKNYVQEVRTGKRINDAYKFVKSATYLQKDIDYYIENNHLVFTEWYHLKRGECCDSGCRHCPYK